MSSAPRFSLLLDGTDVSCWTLAAARVTVGRGSVWEQSAAGTMTVRLYSGSVEGQYGSVALDTLAELWVATTVLPAAAAAGSTWTGSPWAEPDWRLFAGRVTDVTAERSPDRPGWILTVVAAGTLAELSRFQIGAPPWPAESDSERIRRVLDTAGYDTAGIPVLAGPTMFARDIDKQTPATLLRELADSGGGLLWEDHSTADAVTGGALVSYQPLVLRTITSLTLWDQVADTWDDVTGEWDAQMDSPTAPWLLDPCAISADDWTWATTIGDLVTHCVVTYGDNDPETSVSAGTLTPPVYEKKLSSQLQDAADAQALANRTILGRGAQRYSTETAALDVSRIPDEEMPYLRARLIGGRAVRIPGMPAGSPVPELLGFIEGWQHEISVENGALSWWVTLFITDATLTAPATQWNQADPLTWDSITPSDIWDQLLLTGV